MIASAARYVDAARRSRTTSRSTPTRPASAAADARSSLYGRPGCHLCDDARAALRARAGRAPFALDEVDIEADDALHARYLERIPVIALDGEELFDFFVDEADAARPGSIG